MNELTTPFPTLRNYIISDVSIVSYFNTEGYDQQIELTIRNRALPVNDKMIWVINFPSYYSPLIFNYEPYCLIEGSPIKCYADPNTQYQLIIEKSPRIIAAGISYKITILGVACPRVQYMGNSFPNRYIFNYFLGTFLLVYWKTLWPNTTMRPVCYTPNRIFTTVLRVLSVLQILKWLRLTWHLLITHLWPWF